MNMLDRFFHLTENRTNVKIEFLAGLSTFLTMSYILFINPTILAQTGMDEKAVFVATCLAASFGSALMGLYANYPVALAPGLGLSSYFTYSVVLGSGHRWQTALGAVFISGLLFLLLSVLPLRKYIIDSIPKSLKLAIVAGIGLFLGIIGFKAAGIIVPSPTTLVKLGNLHQPTILLAALGFFIIVSLDALKLTTSVIISILIISTLSILLGLSHFEGIFSLPPSIMPVLMQMDVKSAMDVSMTTIIFAFLFVSLFDNTGTLIGIAHRAGLMDKNGRLPRINRVLMVDSTAAIAGSMLGTSTTTSYLESTVGVKVGGRTGLTAVVVAGLFLFALFLSPLAVSIPIYATAPALIYVACMMSHAFTEIDWEDITEYVPAVITAIAMPLTFSIADGISIGFITYVAIKIMSGRMRDLSLPMIVLVLAFIAKYIFLT